MSNKKKIINDPVFGFITIPNTFLYDLIQHPVLQRLNRIRQLGLTSLVYPGAQHTRLLHSIGAMHLMDEAIQVLRLKGHQIDSDEATSAMACILLHDVGHGPFSHALEYTLSDGVSHEEYSLALMHSLNRELDGSLDVAISIFEDKYPKRFLHQLVSGQLDVDRLDYLRRDSFFTGVTEGNIGSARIIKMLDLRDDRLVVEAKGIYSIENFLMARRLMYWQVYLHKTAVAAEKMLVNIFYRAKELIAGGRDIFAMPSLKYFLDNKVDRLFFENNETEVLSHFINLDDNDVWSTLKIWAVDSDFVLSTLSSSLLGRKLFKIQVTNAPHSVEVAKEYISVYKERFGISEHEAGFLCSGGTISTNMYSEADDSIGILYKNGEIRDISEASDMLNIQLLSKTIDKYYLAYFKL